MADNADKRYVRTLFIFRRDLRCDDNIGFLHARSHSKEVIPCYVADETQDMNNHHLQVVIDGALHDLAATLRKKHGRLHVLAKPVERGVKKMITTLGIDAVVMNRGYTPTAVALEKGLVHVCTQSNVAFETHDDAVLHAPEKITKSSGGFYTVFTPFYKKCLQLPPLAPQTAHTPALLKHIADFADYKKTHDFPALDGTTHLSASLASGMCSVRQVYHAVAKTLGRGHPLIRQLYWRDFFIAVGFHRPDVFKGAFHKKYNTLAWKNNRAAFKRWCNGTTGFPIVDAGMRELNATGFMHNRVRMIVASFLIKDLHINWQWGEQYFAQQLADYDQAVNNGNWQWVASTGCDAQPYFRIFNPWLQQKKYDRECIYIKRWIPELVDMPNKDVHAWAKAYKKYPGVYYAPMVDHAVESVAAKIMYKKVA